MYVVSHGNSAGNSLLKSTAKENGRRHDAVNDLLSRVKND